MLYSLVVCYCLVQYAHEFILITIFLVIETVIRGASDKSGAMRPRRTAILCELPWRNVLNVHL